jgi:glycosyltransferase involved in cell wall biosynthesis
MAIQPKITVIIPTRERCDVLESALRTVTSQSYENLNIIVSDNFSSDATFDVVRNFDDKRIKYLNTGKRISMSHNWEFALSTVEDGWVTFIGDDDGLLPEAISSVADIINNTGLMAVRSKFCTYDWPATIRNTNGQLIVPLGSGLSIRDSEIWLSKVMRGLEKYTQLPMIYNGGFIHISILKKIRDITGSFFLSSSPDIYSAIAITSVVDQYAYSKNPLSISGTSTHSIGTSFFSVGKYHNATPSETFSSENNLPFHNALPMNTDGSYPLSLHALVYESYLQSAALRTYHGKVMHAQQLAVIMATAGAHRHSIYEWGKLFAKQHGIDFGTVKKNAALKATYLRPYIALKKFTNALNSVITESLPIKNIFEASIASSVIRSSPGRKNTVRFLTKHLFNMS